jgi:hypothetical protein
LLLFFLLLHHFLYCIISFIHYLLFAKMKSQNFFTDGLFGSVSKTN